MDPKHVLQRYLQVGREALLWKLEGLSPYDVRRPLVPTGTNLLGLVKHTASVEAGYLGAVFGRPFPDEPFPWFADEAEPNADLWATPDESQSDIVDLYRRVWSHSDATIEALDLDAPGHVPWWGDRGDVTLHQILVHVATETHRHAGHADIVRELVDGAVGLRVEAANVPDLDDAAWGALHDRIEAAALAVTRRVSATLEVSARAEVIFELIADPSEQPRWDGNDNLAEAPTGQRVRRVGDVFTMVLSKGSVRENHVVEFEEGRRLAWMPADPGQPPAGHLWRWELEPTGDATTRVTHTYDWSRLTDEDRFARARSTTSDNLHASLTRLAGLATRV